MSTQKILSRAQIREFIQIKTDNYTIGEYDSIVIFTGSTAKTFTLPAATGTSNTLRIINEGTNNALLTIDANASETIKGETTQAIYPGEDLIITDYTTGKWA